MPLIRVDVRLVMQRRGLVELRIGVLCIIGRAQSWMKISPTIVHESTVEVRFLVIRVMVHRFCETRQGFQEVLQINVSTIVNGITKTCCPHCETNVRDSLLPPYARIPRVNTQSQLVELHRFLKLLVVVEESVTLCDCLLYCYKWQWQ